MRPLRRVASVLALVAALSAGSGALPASACACGGAVPLPGDHVTVDGETALVWQRDGVESITMQLSVLATSDETALVVPTPTPATVSAGSPDTFAELENLVAPEEVVEHRWWPEGGFGGGGADGATAGAPSSAPQVLAQVTLGPLEATTLSGGDAEGLSVWLREHGYALDEQMVAALRPYVEDGWAFVAMRLVADDVLAGDLDPVTMTFASDRLVYPMRMSAMAADAQHVRLFVVADHRMMRADPDGNPAETPEFAGWVDAGEVTDPSLAEAVGDRAFLTAFDWTLTPATITSDFAFAPTDDAEHRPTVVVVRDVEVLGVMAGPFLLVSGVLAALLVALVVVALVALRIGRNRGLSPT